LVNKWPTVKKGVYDSERPHATLHLSFKDGSEATHRAVVKDLPKRPSLMDKLGLVQAGFKRSNRTVWTWRTAVGGCAIEIYLGRKKDDTWDYAISALNIHGGGIVDLRGWEACETSFLTPYSALSSAVCELSNLGRELAYEAECKLSRLERAEMKMETERESGEA
jgi:hypothetical protein